MGVAFSQCFSSQQLAHGLGDTGSRALDNTDGAQAATEGTTSMGSCADGSPNQGSLSGHRETCSPNGISQNMQGTSNSMTVFAGGHRANAALDSTAHTGLPYEYRNGAPRVACERERIQTVDALQLVPSPEAAPEHTDPDISAILNLVMSIFQAPCVLLAVCHVEVYLRNTEGLFPWQKWYPRRTSWCPWTMLNHRDATTLIPDTLKDARISDSTTARGPRGIRSYCAAPLIASNGHRLGTLCFLDTKPRQFDAASCMILNNLAEVVVRHLEKSAMVKMQHERGLQLEQLHAHLRRAAESLDQCTAFVEITETGDCKLLYANEAWEKLTGTNRRSIIGKQLSELMCKSDGQPLPSLSVLGTGLAQELCVTDMVTRQGSQRRYQLTFRSATREQIDDFAPAVGVPNYVSRTPTPEGMARPHRYCFVTILPQTRTPPVFTPQRGSAGALVGSFRSAARLLEAGGLQGLEVGELLGESVHGRVFAGRWTGIQVAVKILDQDVRTIQTPPGHVSLQSLLQRPLKHPNLVQTLTYDIQEAPALPRHQRSRVVSDSAHITGPGPSGQNASGQGPSGQNSPGRGMPDVIPEHPGHHLQVSGQTDGPQDAAEQQHGDCNVAAHDLVVVQVPQANMSASASNPESPAPELPGQHVIEHISSGHSTPGRHPSASSALNYDAADYSVIIQSEAGQIVSGHNASGQAPLAFSREQDQHTQFSGQHSSGSSTGGFMYGSNAVSAPTRHCTRIVMEYCDKGTIQDAVLWGWFLTEPVHTQGQPNLPPILNTAREVASALAFLHAHGVVHGDLSATNVLLTSSASDERKFTAKVSDYGLAVARGADVKRDDCMDLYSTAAHLPPETLLDGAMSKATDVYSFGVLLWQMYTGSEPWHSMRKADIIRAARDGRRLQFRPNSWQPLVSLADSCMAREPGDRPGFEQIVAALDDMIASMPQQP